MSHIYTDYLFTLYISGEPISLEALLEQTGTADPATGEPPEDILSAMEDSGLIEQRQVDGTQYISLTKRGKGLSVIAADIAASKMMFEWQQKTSRENVLIPA